MLIEFTVGNFRSFQDQAKISMVAAKIRSRNLSIDENNTFSGQNGLKLLTSASVYGANASGKSNLVRAMAFMRHFVITSSKESQAGDLIPVDTFRLSTITENEPAFFEVVFLMDGVQYRYGFEASKERVITEWLFSVPSTKEATLFIRSEDGIKPSARFKEGKGLEEKTRSNALFLSVVAQFNGLIAKKVVDWFQHIGIVSGLDDTAYRNYTVSKFADGKFRSEIIELIRKLDLGINDIFHESVDKSLLILPNEMPDEFKKLIMTNIQGDITAIKTIHEKWGMDHPSGTSTFDMGDESEGTQKLFFLAGPLLDTLSSGKILIIDELEARLHPLITRTVIGMFNSLATNPNRAQLLFTTHDTNLLSKKYFRRDQIWFIEKDYRGCSHLYSLADLRVRNDASFESDYIDGRYGAIPFIGNIRQVIVDE
ncbi:MAG: ATP-binding protein [Anaerolineaceae bacterium]